MIMLRAGHEIMTSYSSRKLLEVRSSNEQSWRIL